MDIGEYKRILAYKELGISQEKVAQILKITHWQVRKVWNLDEEEFLELKEKERNPLE